MENGRACVNFLSPLLRFVFQFVQQNSSLVKRIRFAFDPSSSKLCPTKNVSPFSVQELCESETESRGRGKNTKECTKRIV